MKKLLISEVKGLEIIDSRGNPTVQAVVTLEGGIQGVGCAPSGASTGMFEAHELRDADPDRFGGKGVSKAVTGINTRIANVLQGKDAMHLWAIDEMMIREDGTDNKSSLGANAILAVSIAVARAASAALGIPLYRYLGGVQGRELPIPMMNILNGGAHAANNLDIQEFMIMPVGAPSVVEGIRWSTEVYHKLASLLKAKGLATAVGDEGGFAPNVSGEKEALDYIMEAIKLAGYEAGRDFVLAIDAAASEWKTQEEGKYKMPKSKREYTSEELVKFWKELSDEYPIYSLEDGLDEEDWDGWKILTSVLGDRLQLVGDDLFVTNIKRLEKGIAEGCGNAILIKPNQIGSLSETMEAIRMAQKNGFRTIISHRSGETEDTTIADLAVAVNAGQIKTGAPCRTERVAKYNRLLAIASEL